MRNKLNYQPIKNRGSPNSSVRKLTKLFMIIVQKDYSHLPIRIELNKKSNMDYYIPYLKTGGLLYNRQLNLIRGLYRKLR